MCLLAAFFRFLLISCSAAAFTTSISNHISIPRTSSSSTGTTVTTRIGSTRLFDLRQTFRFVVTYEGQRCELDAYSDETILAALERNRVMDTLCLPTMPADCRRGNCMTCAGRVTNGLTMMGMTTSPTVLLRRDDDGLAPHVSNILQSSDYVLTCSTYINGNGVEIALGENHNLWEEIYQNRFVSEESRSMTLETLAKVHRLRAESNVPRWTAETEEIIKKSLDIEPTELL